MKPYDDDTIALLESGDLVTRELMLFSFPSGNYGFWTGAGTFSYGGVDYKAAGKIINVQGNSAGLDLSSMPLVATLSEVPGTDLTPDVIASLEAEQWHQTPVLIQRVYIDPDTRNVVSVERRYRGYFDVAEHAVDKSGTYTLTANFESKSRDHMKKGYRTAGDADQRRIDPDDAFFQYAAVAGSQPIYWGQKPSTAASAVQAGSVGGRAEGSLL